MKEYNKLIRDKIPEIIEASNKTFTTHIASSEEYWTKLREKLTEEVNEFLDDENPKELADILEVIYAICDEKGISKDKLEAMRKEKSEKRGAFIEKIILEKVM
jgi:predicted house-cleaning noncanonical NTP pyrophosphatase (MazG superfamily)